MDAGISLTELLIQQSDHKLVVDGWGDVNLVNLCSDGFMLVWSHLSDKSWQASWML